MQLCASRLCEWYRETGPPLITVYVAIMENVLCNPHILSGYDGSRDQPRRVAGKGCLALVLQHHGTCEARVAEQSCTLRPGTVLLLDSSRDCEASQPSPESETIGIEFDFWQRPLIAVDVKRPWHARRPLSQHPCRQGWQGCFNDSIPLILPAAQSHRLRAPIQAAARHWWRDDHGRLIATGHLTQALAALLRWYPPHGQPITNSNDFVAHVQRQARALAMRGGDVGELASVFNLSRAHFTRRYHQLSGESPGQLLRRERLKAIADELGKGHSPQHIAQELGWPSTARMREFVARSSGQPWRGWRQDHSPP